MLLADAEGFWKWPPNVYDAATVLGTFLGLVSIWLSWWLARRDIKKRLAAAAEQAASVARDELRQLGRVVLRAGVAEAILTLAVAREACRSKEWPRAVDLCELAREQLVGVLARPAAIAELRTDVQNVISGLLDCARQLRRKREAGAGPVPEDVLRVLQESNLTLRQVEGRITSI
jgi:hypothetical protein